MAKFSIVTLSIVSLNMGIAALTNYNPIHAIIHGYAKWVFVGAGIIGALMLYGLFKR